MSRWSDDPSRLRGPAARRLRASLARLLFQAPATLAVGFRHGDNALQVWSVVERWTDETVEPIYALELRIMRRFRRFRFDFYTVAAEGASVEAAFDGPPGDMIVRPHA